MFRANVASVFFDQSYLKKKYTYIILNEYIYISHADTYLKKIDKRLDFMLDIVILQTCKK